MCRLHRRKVCPLLTTWLKYSTLRRFSVQLIQFASWMTMRSPGSVWRRSAVVACKPAKNVSCGAIRDLVAVNAAVQMSGGIGPVASITLLGILPILQLLSRLFEE